MSAAPHFERYAGTGSGVTQFAVVDGAMHVRFHDDRVYVYNDVRPGAAEVREMIRLARAGRGLSTYISQHIGHRFARQYKLTNRSS
jgi:hypothetical protein